MKNKRVLYKESNKTRKIFRKIVLLTLVACFFISFIAFLNREFEYIIFGMVAYARVVSINNLLK